MTTRPLATLVAALACGGCLVPAVPYEPLVRPAARVAPRPATAAAATPGTAEPAADAPVPVESPRHPEHAALAAEVEALRAELERVRERDADRATELEELTGRLAAQRLELEELERRNGELSARLVAERTRHLEAEKAWLEARIAGLEESLGRDER